MTQKIKPGAPLAVLSLEDSERDFEIICELLTDAGFHLKIERVETENDFTAKLHSRAYDIILSDFKLPGFNAFKALQLACIISPGTPFLCVSGSIGEETAIELIKQGAVDYILKDKPDRLPVAVQRALEEAMERKKRKEAEGILQESEQKYRSLIEGSPDAIVIYSEGKIVFANFSSALLWGTTSVDKLIGKPVGDYFHFDSKDFIAKRMTETSTLGKALPMAEEKIIRSDGSEVDVEIKAIPIVYDKRPAIQIIVHDITERKKAKEVLLNKMNELERFHRLTVGRELTMIELKKEVNELLKKSGHKEKYKIVE
ncbi:MAG: PAS domain S-box protein [Bacteroidota bacterium]|nr:PAS domain S-box protein [Bacteroidota bacterium]